MNSQVKRNYLEINSINELIEKEKPLNNLYLYKVDPPDFQLNKFFYKEVGKKIITLRAGNVVGGGDWKKNRLVPDT